MLRAGLVARLREQGAIRTVAIADAFAAVPRHLFVPGEPLERCYANESVIIKQDEDGVVLSTVSPPLIQAMMLEQARLAPGMRVLEIGSGGYNAALMAELTGAAGEVTTVDIDPHVTGRASRFLAEAGYGRVNVVLGDAEHGVSEHAPYDRIVVTAGAWDIPPAWIAQLAPGGRMVIPLRMRGLTRSVAFERAGGHLVSLEHEMCQFVPMQGAGARSEHLIPLHGEDVGLRIEDGQAVDAVGIRESLLGPPTEQWTGVRFADLEPFDGVYLWLATYLDNFGLLTRKETSTARQLVKPVSPVGTPTLIDGPSFAYLTFRQLAAAADKYEFGVYAHGADAPRLADRMAALIGGWSRGHRTSAAQISAYPAGTPDEQLPAGLVIGKRHTRITISWP